MKEINSIKEIVEVVEEFCRDTYLGINAFMRNVNPAPHLKFVKTQIEFIPKQSWVFY